MLTTQKTIAGGGATTTIIAKRTDSFKASGRIIGVVVNVDGAAQGQFNDLATTVVTPMVYMAFTAATAAPFVITNADYNFSNGLNLVTTGAGAWVVSIITEG